MFETPVDAVYVWVGLGVASVTALGLAVQLPTTAPPDATGLADTVDATATSEYPATAEFPSTAEAARIGSQRVTLRNDGGSATATVVATVVPARSGRLAAVLHGADPRRVFDSRAAFRAAVEAAPDAQPRWRETDGTFVVRRLSWGETDVTLVGD
jgi:hypothetical protein